MIQFSKFVKSYGSVKILEIDDMKVEPGVYWLQGLNGSGKSTLLNCMAGILHFEGQVTVNNIDSKSQPVAFRRMVNFAEAEPLFPEFLTGTEMIDLFSAAKSAPLDQSSRFIESMQMQHYIGQQIRSYSTGMIKKLSVLLAFLGNPALILLDEPLITVDSGSLKVLNQWIVDQVHLNGTSFILSSHQPLDSIECRISGSLVVEGGAVRFVA